MDRTIEEHFGFEASDNVEDVLGIDKKASNRLCALP